MRAYETTTRVEPGGEVRLHGVPFTAGTEVDVIVAQKRRSAEEFSRAWEELCHDIRALPQIKNISKEDVQREVKDYREGR